MIKPGISTADVHNAVCDIFEKKGYETYRSGSRVGFIHSTGHGVGLDVDELPAVAMTPCKNSADAILSILFSYTTKARKDSNMLSFFCSPYYSSTTGGDPALVSGAFFVTFSVTSEPVTTFVFFFAFDAFFLREAGFFAAFTADFS